MSETVRVIEADVTVSKTDLSFDAGVDAQLVVTLPIPTTDTTTPKVLVAQNEKLRWADPSELIKQFFIDNNLEHLLELNKITT